MIAKEPGLPRYMRAAALAKLDDPVRYFQIASAVGDPMSARQHNDWKAAVNALAKQIKAERAAQAKEDAAAEREREREERIANAMARLGEQHGEQVRTFSASDNAHLAMHLYDHFTSPAGVCPAVGFQLMQVYDDRTGLWSARKDDEGQWVVQDRKRPRLQSSQ